MLPTKKIAVAEPIDPVKKDLIDYLKQIKLQNQDIERTDSAKNYYRNVLGTPNEDDEKVLLSKMGLQAIPDATTQSDKYDEYLKKWSEMSEKIIKSKTIKERFQITKNYYTTEANYFSQITPVTNDVEEIHKHLIRSNELAAKAYENFVSGVNLGYISDVKEGKDGYITWSMNLRSREYSDNFKQCKEESENEEKTYFRVLEQLVMRYNLLNEYQAAYPIKGFMKALNLKESGVKSK